jgi:hypothetical protein
MVGGGGGGGGNRGVPDAKLFSVANGEDAFGIKEVLAGYCGTNFCTVSGFLE